MVKAINELYTCIQAEGKFTGVPHILIRMSGCPMRCAFGNSLCDTPYSSWVPEKGEITEEDIYAIYTSNPHIAYTMISGGEPFFNEEVLHHLINIAKKFNHYVTIETAGIKYVETNADFISLSPKLQSSVPNLKDYTIEGKVVNVSEAMIYRHETLRRNYDEMSDLIHFHPNYQIKPVISNIEKDMEEVRQLLFYIDADPKKVYLMPAGTTNEELQQIRPSLIEFCVREGYNYTDRIHVVAYGTKRGV